MTQEQIDAFFELKEEREKIESEIKNLESYNSFLKCSNERDGFDDIWADYLEFARERYGEEYIKLNDERIAKAKEKIEGINKKISEL
jgi:hypothetical protein